MENILNKLSSYSFLNHILAGGIYCILANEWGLPSISLSENTFVNIIAFYFTGSVIDRFGGIVLEKILLKLKIIKDRSYSEFLYAEQNDKRIIELSEVNHIYKTFTSLMFIVSLFLILKKLYKSEYFIEITIGFVFSLVAQNINLIFALTLFILFLLSFRKQTKYIVSRIEKAIKDKNEHS